MSEARLRMGLVGAGHFGRFHALKVAAAPRARLVGVHDPDTARAAAVGREAGGARRWRWTRCWRPATRW